MSDFNLKQLGDKEDKPIEVKQILHFMQFLGWTKDDLEKLEQMGYKPTQLLHYTK